MKVDCVLDARATVGEGAIWSVKLQCLLWVDIPAGHLNIFDPSSGDNRVIALDRPVGCVAETARGSVIAALTDGFFEVDLITGAQTRICGPAPAERGHRFNDGTTDRQGRFLAGTMPQSGPKEDVTDGTLYIYDGGQSSEIMDGFHTINGMAVSPEGTVLYISDSFPAVRRIWAFDYDPDDAAISNRRAFFDTNTVAGRPDGATVDADGCYWMAGVSGGQLYRITPQGRVDLTIDMPVSRPTRPAFGGPDLDMLYVTSIRTEGEPLSGGVFALRVPGVTGLPNTMAR